MKFRQRKKMLVSLLAVMSMFVSAVSACACAHHSASEVEETAASCHSSSHSVSHEPFAEQETPSGPAAGVDCDCFVRIPVPAISAKTDSKKTGQNDKNESGEPAQVDYVLPEFAASGIVFPASSKPSSYSFQPGLSAPSRAPPRL